MSGRIKWLVFLLVIATAYGVAWHKAYVLSSDYYDFAQEQFQQGNYITAIKGKNKLEMRRSDTYLGGYQQVVETWEHMVLGLRPDFYYLAKQKVDESLSKLSSDELLLLIETYVELDLRYVPEAALRLKNLASAQGNQLLYSEMDEFLIEAFPEFSQEGDQ
ncbi:hypothetical protein [Vibrio tapetis]|uniref:Uncharacterized protein n=1 Tax=Vibrio tapetis subsp. tapetis TaxID=1671868 RepID=A0A2N8ZMZ2_9VIBR|nr:hypothetical protein [Vibrio tapetis]SON53229.1 conserved protein of unknown function [Vibrio tapetis subsp. tapetis]